MHSPIVNFLTPSANAEHSLPYVIPSPPQTGAYTAGQALGSSFLQETPRTISKRRRSFFMIYLKKQN
jgi:hypothetical protein